jgi:hypothetical protein
MNVEIGAEAELFPEKEYINGIAVAVHLPAFRHLSRHAFVCSVAFRTHASLSNRLPPAHEKKDKE